MAKLIVSILQVSQILRHNESIVSVSGGGGQNWTMDEVMPAATYSIESVDSNQLASNYPIEDKLAAARCLHTTGHSFVQSALVKSLIP